MKNKINNIALALATSCLIIGTVQAGTATTTFSVTANILDSCTIIANDLDFGDVNLEEGAEADTYVEVNCDKDSAYATLDGGLHLDGTQRRIMQNIGNEDSFVKYNLYTEASKTEEFSTVNGADFGGTLYLNKNGDGPPGYIDGFPIYGEIPVQEGKPSGLYNDIIQVMITY